MMEDLCPERIAPAWFADAARIADRATPTGTDVAGAFVDLMEGRRLLVAIVEAPGRRLVVVGPQRGRFGVRARGNTVVALLCGGRSMKQVAMELGKAMATVSKHLKVAMAALGVESSVVLVNALAPLAASVRGTPPSGARVSHFDHDGERFVVLGVDHDVLAQGKPVLTPAEHAVVELVQRGMSNRAIARARRRSPRTIANQLARTFGKLGVHSRVELVLALQSQRRESA